MNRRTILTTIAGDKIKRISNYRLALISLLSIVGLTACGSESIYELKDIGGAAFLLNKQTGSVSMLRSGKVVQLQDEEVDDTDKPVKDMGANAYTYNQADGFNVSLKTKWNNSTLHYKIAILPNPVGKPFGKLTAAYLESLENAIQRAAIIFSDKDDFKIAEIAFPKLKSVIEQGIARPNKDSSIPGEYFGEDTVPMSQGLYDQIQSWRVENVKVNNNDLQPF